MPFIPIMIIICYKLIELAAMSIGYGGNMQPNNMDAYPWFQTLN